MIFGAKESWDIILYDSKVFYPLTSFYPTFVTSKVEHIWVVNMKSEQTSRLKKWGKKLVRGVKNFWIFSISISAFICTKNYQKIFKTRECRLVCANVNICAESGKKKAPPLMDFDKILSFLVKNEWLGSTNEFLTVIWLSPNSKHHLCQVSNLDLM